MSSFQRIADAVPQEMSCSPKSGCIVLATQIVGMKQNPCLLLTVQAFAARSLIVRVLMKPVIWGISQFPILPHQCEIYAL